jgi:MerR family transcriptional regulator, thiopeptide resistance regulator
MVDPEGTEEKLTAAACAARTGLTVRALRVYERSGLLDPPRARSGWRQYGPRELTRLNTVCVLKTAGLTLAQIRAVLHHRDPPLQEILQAQIENWNRKQADADRGKRTAETALQQLQTHQALNVDVLCELIRSNQEGSIAPAMGEFMQRILALPAKEQAEWVSRHNEQINPRSAQDFQEAVRTRIDPALEKLLNAGAAPASPKVQKVIVKYLDLMRQYKVRETAIEWLTGAGPEDDSGSESAVPLPPETIARRVLPRLKHRPTEASDVMSSQWTSNPFLVGFFAEAERQSAQCQALDELLLEVQDSVQAGIESHSPQAERVVAKFRAICRKYGLGDPVIYTRWAALVRPPPADMTEAEDKRIWGFIADSMAAP